ncbi:MAG: GMP/IMP nucleotidase [Gammaproteobacteria bacterium]|nr:GMP/IMP nucleotidase [Gammaproteobacteria bacterium]
MALPDLKDIDTVLLDLDGTLLDLHFDNHFWLEYVPVCYARQHDIALDKAQQVLMQRYNEVRGSLDWYCIEFWTRELGLDIEQLKREVAHKIAVHPFVHDFLQSARARSKQVVLVTNAHPASLTIKMEKTELVDYFDSIITSHELGLAKEQDGFWEKLQAVNAYDPQKTLLIDDNHEVLECAERYGIRHLLAIHRPDSKGDEKSHERYHLLRSFEEITL